MGTLLKRKRKDGSTGYTAMVRIKRAGEVIHQETETFDREQAAKAWMKKRETELAAPGALAAILQPAPDPTLAEVIDIYVASLKKGTGKTKQQVLNTIKSKAIGSMKCSDIKSQHILAFAAELGTQPQTVGNYLSHLATVFKLARPAWGYPLDYQAIQDARTVAKHQGSTARSAQRDRRPTLGELDKLLAHFWEMERRDPRVTPMCAITLFGIFSTRRQAEITRVTFADLDEKHAELVVRDMKHPGEKMGNDVRTHLPDEALRLVLQRRSAAGPDGRIFPYNPETISRHFTEACTLLGIEDLHFHDLRHDGISRLFELGWAIPKVATVSGHRTWSSLKRYTHMRQQGDKYAGWHWLTRLGVAAGKPALKVA